MTPWKSGSRRSLLVLLWAAAAPTAWAQQPKLTAVGVFSLLGDSVQVVSADDAPRDTRIEKTSRQTMDFENIGFDMIALRAAREAINQASPGVRVEVFKSNVSMSVEDQRAIAEGAQRAELPDWMVRTIQDKKLSHVLIVTRFRSSIDARTGDGVAIGRGQVDGIGFYMDTLYEMRNRQTGALSSGLLAPYMNIRLTLMDTDTAEIVGSYDVKEAFAYASPEVQVVSDPWSFMPATDKVKTMREMVERGVARGVRGALDGKR